MIELEQKQVLKGLVDVASPYWGAEREAVVRFLQTPLDAAQHTRTLGFLCHKEAWGSGLAKDGDGLIGGPIFRSLELSKNRDETLLLHSFLTILADNFKTLGESCSLEEFQADLKKATFIAQTFEPQDSPIREELEVAKDEYSHFKLFAEIARDFFGQNFSPMNVKEFQSSWDSRLQRTRGEVRRVYGDLGAAASKLTEGGGGAIFDGMQMFFGVEYSEYQNRWAEVGTSVFGEEIGHMHVGMREVSSLIKTDADLLLTTVILRDLSGERVRMRNEIFGNPLDENEISQLFLGISPFKPFTPEPILREIA